MVEGFSQPSSFSLLSARARRASAPDSVSLSLPPSLQYHDTVSDRIGRKTERKNRLLTATKSAGERKEKGFLPLSSRSSLFFLPSSSSSSSSSSLLPPPHALLPGTNSSDTPFMQYRSPVGLGPSGKTCPRCPLHLTQWTSVRRMKKALSTLSSTEEPSVVSGAKNEGQPVPLSNLAELENSLVPHPAHVNVPWRFSLLSGLVKGRSVPCYGVLERERGRERGEEVERENNGKREANASALVLSRSSCALSLSLSLFLSLSVGSFSSAAATAYLAEDVKRLGAKLGLPFLLRLGQIRRDGLSSPGRAC